MPSHVLPCIIIQRILDYLSPRDIASRTCLLNRAWHKPSLARLYRTIPPFSSAFQLARACTTIIAHPQDVAPSVIEVYIVHSMRDVHKIPMLYYTVRAALALCTKLETLYLHTDPSLMRVMLGECTFRLRVLSIVDCHPDLPTVFLSRQESLEELTVIRGDSPPLYLPKNALPSLSSLSGIPENVIRISRGRKLKTLRILPGPTPLNLSDMLLSLDSLVISSLKEFQVLVTGSVLHHVIVLAQFLPHLAVLVLRYHQKNVPFTALANTVSAFVSLREVSMLSMNAQPQLTPVVLDSESAIVTHYGIQCPALQAVALRSVRWVRNEGETQWSPDPSYPDVLAMWRDSPERLHMDAREAENILHELSGDTDECSSGDFVNMDLDGTSEEGSKISCDEESTPYQLPLCTEEAGSNMRG